MADHARGETFRRLREERHLSQEDAAHELGVSVKTVRAWEHGKGIKWENAKVAGRFYGVDPETLVDRELPAGEVDVGQLAAELAAIREGVAALLDEAGSARAKRAAGALRELADEAPPGTPRERDESATQG